MGTKKLKSESRKHSSADRQKDREETDREVSGLVSRKNTNRRMQDIYKTLKVSGRGRAAGREIKTYKKVRSVKKCSVDYRKGLDTPKAQGRNHSSGLLSCMKLSIRQNEKIKARVRKG